MDGDAKKATAGTPAKVDLHGAAEAAAETTLALPSGVREQQGTNIDYSKEHNAGAKHKEKKPLSLLVHGDLHGAARAAAEAVIDSAANPVLDSAAAFAPVPYPVDRPSLSKADQKHFLSKTFKF